MAQQPARRLIGLLMILLLLGAAACTEPPVEQIPVRETPSTAPQLATPTPEILADCFPGADVFAWLDENGNGIWDEGEPPLAGIEFYLGPTAAFSYETTGEDGLAHISAWAPGECLVMQITAVTFTGYTLTTPQKVDYLSTNSDYRFGFQPESEASLPTDSLLVVGDDGFALSAAWPVTAVNTLFTWVGEGPAANEFEQIELADGRFIHPNGTDVTTQVQALLVSLTDLEPVDTLSYVNAWTDDYPAWYLELVGKDGRTVLIYSESTGFRGHAPWYVQIGDQFYSQVNGDLGFAVYDLVSEDVQDYFSLDEADFDQTWLEPGGRTTIFWRGLNFTGLLPVAPTLNYQVDPASGRLQGHFAMRDYGEYDSSTHPIIGVAQMTVTLPDGQAQDCLVTPEAFEFGETVWLFDCPLPAAGLATAVAVTLQFTTATEYALVTTGHIYLANQ